GARRGRDVDPGEPDRQQLQRALPLARARPRRDHPDHHRRCPRHRPGQVAARSRRSLLLGHSSMSATAAGAMPRGATAEPLSRTVSGEVRGRIRETILPGGHAPGAQLLQDSLAAGQLPMAGDLTCAFHLALVVPRLNPVTSEVLYRLHTLSERYVRLHLQPAGRVTRAAREHHAIYRAWARRDGKETERLVRA